MSEQRPAQQWIVKVNGVEEVRLDPGESLEIGRKPLRPLADDGMRRLDVPDQTKSMSKRHAAFSVSAQGAGSLRDLNSTNGTYVVRDDGELMRIPPQADFLLPRATMRFQFGDVPVDFVRVEVTAADEAAGEDVPNLFSYASTGAQDAEPDAADMSVDDILDLRAGEPTGAFDASSVRSRIGALHDRAVASGTGAIIASDGGQRDLFADAIDEVQAGVPAADAEPSPFVGAADIAAAAQASTPTVVPSAGVPGVGVPTESAHPVAQTSPFAQSNPVVQPFVQPTVQPVQTVQPAQEAAQPVVQPTVQPVIQQQPVVQPQQVQPVQSTAQPVQTAAPASTFEPGSVFEMVSRRTAEAARPAAIEAGGHTSDQAKVTRDFAAQFDMARYPQLLPFLAMNPALYDDLYAWLSALGDKDIDAALERNEGYRDYRKAMGK
ncbi:FHA domain-containing protein [Bifidobacterium avesanii]|uniref:FHA domain-containing protein n=1 Tax=Bifidobacterium avesanii TaxID=1798157 RepID=UPI00137F6EB9|nr:FHA domain-containing protein [Bifidobacterium avesanii]KAB8294642.1 hypothetical protein DSM100685_0435 [Bifidobacterium avesanii]